MFKEDRPVGLIDPHAGVSSLHVRTDVEGRSPGGFDHEVHELLAGFALIVVVQALPIVLDPRIVLHTAEQIIGRRADRVVAAESLIEGLGYRFGHGATSPLRCFCAAIGADATADYP